jgi:hypothetical protein
LIDHSPLTLQPATTYDLEVDFLAVDLFLAVFLAVFLAPFFLATLFFFALFFFLGAGTLAPFFLASDKPMAIAWSRLVTFLPLLPLRKVPFFLRRMALPTVFCDFFEYLAITVLFN